MTQTYLGEDTFTQKVSQDIPASLSGTIDVDISDLSFSGMNKFFSYTTGIQIESSTGTTLEAKIERRIL